MALGPRHDLMISATLCFVIVLFQADQAEYRRILTFLLQ